MRLPIMILLSSLLGVAGCEPANAEVPDSPLDEHRWKHRVVLISAPTLEAPALREQLKRLETNTLEGRRALGERHIVLYILPTKTPKDCERIFFQPNGETTSSKVDASTCARLARRIGASSEESFAFSLVGKDGGAKLESKEPVSKDRLFSRIDAMPMRMREMREQKSQGT